MKKAHTFSIESDLVEQLKIIANHERRSMSSQLEMLISEAFCSYYEKYPQIFNDDNENDNSHAKNA